MTAATAEIKPTIDGIEVELGDIVSCDLFSGLAAQYASATRVKGWSPCGRYLYLSWVSVVPTDACRWVYSIKDRRFCLLYKPETENRWEYAVRTGKAKRAGFKG